ncbi:MAG: outer membrane lipoprotein-sorting protein [Candidatus Aminicenantes bacterium]|nr:outer membrane lipoprotein-sorting protein [Candidatus Aminicenantes bacterium]
MKRILFILVLILMVLAPEFTAEEKDPFDILNKIDSNMTFESAYAEMEMIITIKKREIIKKFKSYSVGNTRSFIEFLSPVRDRGTKILKKDKIIKIYYPSAERILRLSGHMLRQSMMGSDMSYEDMTERSNKLREEYSGEMLQNEVLDGNKCFVLMLTSKVKKQTYFKRKIWVDIKKFVGLKEELYSKSGKLVKVSKVIEIKLFKNRYYPVEMTMEDKLRKNSSTRIVIKKIDFNIDIPDEMFTERMLLK